MTCKDCENHNECEKKEKLLFDIDDICELIYQHGVQISCQEFKKGSKEHEQIF